ncbi:Hypothetical_protein [Hexamita inflata]|uniref:Hypothetical_protein n=1 Tax=Hexamita inflata TaxID=28002 RepID=A0AA86PEN1_9EUKA|nr:Hypothetical protein HINF_LOCUS22134 [Hexamita inflata]
MAEDSNSSESNSQDEMSMCSFASQLSEHSEKTYKEEYYVINDLVYKKDNQTYKEEYYVINDLRYNKDKESYIFKVLYAERFYSDISCDYETTGPDIVTVNHDLINSKPYTSMGIYCQGAFQVFDFSNLSLVTKEIHKVSIVEGIIDLSLLKGSIQCLKLTSCKVQNSWNPEFHCEELQVTSRYNDISWLQHVKCKRIKWQYIFVEANYDLLKIKYDNLVNVSFNWITVNLSLLHLKVNNMQIKCCDIVDYATNNLIVEYLSIIRSTLKTTQLLNAQIQNLIIQNVFQGVKEMKNYKREQYNPTIIDDLPNVQNVKIDYCQFKLKTFSNPKINKLKLETVEKHIAFKFFQNIQNINKITLPQYLKEYQGKLKKNQQKQNNKLNQINKNIQRIKEIIPKLQNRTKFISTMVFISSGAE